MSDFTPDVAKASSPDVATLRRNNRRRVEYLPTETDEKLMGLMSDKHSEIIRQTGSMSEIAARLGVAVGTVKSRTHRARVELDVLRTQTISERH